MLRSPNLSAVSTTGKTSLPFGGMVEIPQVSPLNPVSSTSKWRFKEPSFKVITVALHEPVYSDVPPLPRKLSPLLIESLGA